MKGRSISYTFILLLIGIILMIVNGVVIALDNGPKVISSYQANFTTIWKGDLPWARIIFGIPGLVESGWAYFWLALVLVLLIITIRIGLRPKAQKKFGPWIVGLSILSIPIGGGFYIGSLLGAIVGLYAMEFPRPFEETFIGRIIGTLTGNTKTFEGLNADPKGLQAGVMAVVLVAILGGIGSCLYAINLSHIYIAGNAVNSTAASRVLLEGRLYTGLSFYTSVVALITIGILKWLVLSALVYVLGVKLLGSDTKFGGLTGALAFVYVPECLFVIMPAVFSNQPYLSQSFQFIIIPVSWPLVLFYLSHLWGFVLLVLAIEKLLDISRGKAFGTGLLISVPYFVITYLAMNPLIGIPGLQILFTSESSMMILFLSSVVLLVAGFLGAFRKE